MTLLVCERKMAICTASVKLCTYKAGKVLINYYEIIHGAFQIVNYAFLVESSDALAYWKKIKHLCRSKYNARSKCIIIKMR